MPRVTHQTDAAPRLPPAALPHSSSARSGLHPPIDVGATGSILSLLNRERFAPSVDAPSSSLSQPLWIRNGRSRSINALPSYEKQGGALQGRLETVAESETRVSKWKQFLRKFKGGAKKGDGSKGSKPIRTALSEVGKQQPRVESLRDACTNVGASKDRQVLMISSTPCQKLQPREKPSSLLWERRNVAQIEPLDLTRLRQKKDLARLKQKKPAKAR